MILAVEKVSWPEVSCACWHTGTIPAPTCVCGKAEKALRAWIDGRRLPPMTAEQREACLVEIDAIEGHSRKEFESATDADLARGVLDAWTDFCRDKGMM